MTDSNIPPRLAESIRRYDAETLARMNAAPGTPPAAPTKTRPGDQPLPTGGEECVQDALIALIEERKQLGIQRYGSPLMTHNGRDAGQDMVEEAVDLAVYSMQVAMELQDLRAAVARVRAVVHIADVDDVTDWQRGFRACSVVALGALEAPTTVDIPGDNFGADSASSQVSTGDPVDSVEDSEPDTCRDVDLDGETIRVRGVGDMSTASREALAEIVRAARRKFAEDHPPVEPADPERRERYAEALYVTLEVTPRRHPWATLSPLRRAVWYARADAAMAMADVELEEAQAAIERVRAMATTQAARGASGSTDHKIGMCDAAVAILAALDGPAETEQQEAPARNFAAYQAAIARVVLVLREAQEHREQTDPSERQDCVMCGADHFAEIKAAIKGPKQSTTEGATDG